MAAHDTTPGKRYLSHTLADWACSLQYVDLSAAAIQAAKLFWYDSLGCALGGSQQKDAKILLEHHWEMAGEQATKRPSDEATKGKCTCFVAGFKTNPVDAALLNSQIGRAHV